MTHVALIRLSWPPAPLWPNRSRGKAWQGRAHSDDAYKREGSIAAYGQIGTLRQITAPRLVVTFHKADRRRYDLDNAYAALKPAIDGICERWGRDDSEIDHVTLIRGEPVAGGCVLIEVSEVAPPVVAVELRGVVR